MKLGKDRAFITGRLIFAVFLITGCAGVVSSARSAPPIVVPPETRAPAKPVEAAPSSGPPTTQARFVVAGKDGVFVLDAAGGRRRVGKAKDAAAPRFVPGRRAIVFLHANTEFVELDLETGVERVVAGPWRVVLECPRAPSVSLELQADDDVKLDVDGRHACVALWDRNLNMASFGVSIRADLVAHTFEARAELGCTDAETDVRTVCNEGVEPRAVPAEHPYALDEKASVLRSPSGAVWVRFADWAVHAKSPSGRWLVMRGNVEEGDYIHFNLFVVDLLTGAVWPVPERVPGTKTAWPAELNGDELADPSRKRLGARAGDYVGESTVRFVEPDVLVVGELLLLLTDQRVIELDGDLAR
jgi:hypothetical protein